MGWDPYPTCEGDVRETKDGCDPCPGPFGGPRNRTAEAGGRSGGNGGGAKVASRKSNSIPRASGIKQSGSGGGRRRGGGAKRKNGGSRNGGQKRSGGSPKRNGGGRKTNGGGKRKSGGGQNRAKNGGKAKSGGAGGCPDAVLEACIDVCPGSNAKVFGACVAGCSKR